MFFKAALLAALVKLLIETESPLLCASIYVAGGVVLHVLLGSFMLTLIPSTVLGFILAYAYFWLLNRVEDFTFPWWTILVVGLLIGLV